MAAKGSKREKPDGTPQEIIDKLTRFNVERIPRDAIKKADYNPRMISDKARDRLKGILKAQGLVEPLVWNRRSGTLVSGHQRLSILDSEAGGKDYQLAVSVIDVDDATERQLNVALNNPEAMGEYDIAKLGQMLKDDKLSLKAMGLDAADKFRMFGGDLDSLHGDEAVELADRLAESRAMQDKILANNNNRDDPDFYFVFVAASKDDADDFLRRLQEAGGEADFPDNRYQSIAQMRRVLGWPAFDEKAEEA